MCETVGSTRQGWVAPSMRRRTAGVAVGQCTCRMPLGKMFAALSQSWDVAPAQALALAKDSLFQTQEMVLSRYAENVAKILTELSDSLRENVHVSPASHPCQCWCGVPEALV